MPRPASPSAIQRPDLAAIAHEAQLNAPEFGFIGPRSFPIYEVEDRDGDFPKIPAEQFLKVTDTRRASRAGYQRDDWEFETGTYACEEHGYEEPVDEVEARMYRSLFDAEAVAVERATQKILRGHEIRVVEMVTNPSIITLTDTPTTAWNGVGPVPLLDITLAKTALRLGGGITANSVIMSYQTFQLLIILPEIVDYLKYTRPVGVMGFKEQTELVAAYFGLEQCLVAGAMYDKADKGLAADIAGIWPDDCVLVARLAAPGDALGSPCLGRTFLWTRDSMTFLVTEQYNEPEKRSNIYRVRQHTDERLIFASAGFLLTGIV